MWGRKGELDCSVVINNTANLCNILVLQYTSVHFVYP